MHRVFNHYAWLHAIHPKNLKEYPYAGVFFFSGKNQGPRAGSCLTGHKIPEFHENNL
jgi:hypothetical protein